MRNSIFRYGKGLLEKEEVLGPLNAAPYGSSSDFELYHSLDLDGKPLLRHLDIEFSPTDDSWLDPHDYIEIPHPMFM